MLALSIINTLCPLYLVLQAEWSPCCIIYLDGILLQPQPQADIHIHMHRGMYKETRDDHCSK